MKTYLAIWAMVSAVFLPFAIYAGSPFLMVLWAVNLAGYIALFDQYSNR